MLQVDLIGSEEGWIGKSRLKAKICLVGEAGVGKTSLIRRFVLDQFDSKYIKTIGTKVSKKSVHLYDKGREREVEVVLTIWDIMGQEGFRELLKNAYFAGANGILAVCDVTSTESMNKLDGWLDRTYKIAGDVPISILINKMDLIARHQVNDEILDQFCKAYDCSRFYTSAKSGENVQPSFIDIATRIMMEQKHMRSDMIAIIE